jgi:hypothetical protein
VSGRRNAVRPRIENANPGIPDSIPLDACYVGWQESLRFLAKLVESEIAQ